MNPTHQGGGVSLRPYHPDDEEFLVALYRSTRENELAMVPWDEDQRRTFVRFQHSAQLRHYQTEYPDAEHRIIEIGGIPAGRIYIDRRQEEIRILDITLAPEHRGKGIGTPIIQGVMLEAAQSGRSVSINLDSIGDGSRSASLFVGLGFIPLETRGFHTLFIWRAPER